MTDKKGTTEQMTKAITKTDPRAYAQAMLDSKLSGKGEITKFETLDQSTLAELFDKFEMEPPIAEVKDGQIVRGRLIGKGSPVEMASQGKDPLTGVEKPGNTVNTWVIDVGNGVKVRIMSGYQLDHWLPGKEGKIVVLVKGAKKDRGQKQVREWLTGVLKEDGDTPA